MWVLIATILGVLALVGVAMSIRAAAPEPQEQLVLKTAASVDADLRALQDAIAAHALDNTEMRSQAHLSAVQEALRELPSEDGTREELDALWTIVRTLGQLRGPLAHDQWSRLAGDLQTGLARLPASAPLAPRIRSVGTMVAHMIRDNSEGPELQAPR